ncbi:hypothetical protein [Natrinema sp. CGMCC1.2065]|uniref:hypothetical protein n=1 Tax=Natrinema sp. CGMCC1.2065 TaxID=3445767 RepID=UPI003F49F4AC
MIETQPDGATLAPHHFTWGALLTAWAATYSWDRFTDREPLMLSLGVVAGLFSFVMLWRYYVVAGAAGTFIGTVITTAGLVRFRRYASRPSFWVAAFGVYAMWDDWASHALSIWTPLDWLFEAYVHGIIS